MNLSSLSLATAEFASSALVLVADVQSCFPGVQKTLSISSSLLTRCVVCLTTKPKPKTSKPVIKRQPPKLKVVEPEVEEVRSAWEPSSPNESSRCKALLLEILRRAAHDWVLYRSHHRLTNREIAEDAYEWLFEEDEDHQSWTERAKATFVLDDTEVSGVRNLTSFLSICEVLELDPTIVRNRVKKMDVQTIISAGRPAETRRHKDSDTVSIEEYGVGFDMSALAQDRFHDSHYESYGAVSTSETLYSNDAAY